MPYDVNRKHGIWVYISMLEHHRTDHRHPTLWAHHTDIAWHSSLAANITAHHLQNCADDVRLFSRPMSDVLCCLYRPLLHVRDYNQQTMKTSSFHVCGWPDLPAADSSCLIQQFGTNFHRICKAQTPGNGNSLSALSAGYSSVCTTGGVSDRRWLKACRTNLLTYLLTYLFT